MSRDAAPVVPFDGFERFAKLDSSREAIEAYAGEYGLLGIETETLDAWRHEIDQLARWYRLWSGPRPVSPAGRIARAQRRARALPIVTRDINKMLAKHMSYFDEDGRFLETPVPRGLLGMIWRDFARHIARSRRTCGECGTPFAAWRRDQRTCPKPACRQRAWRREQQR